MPSLCGIALPSKARPRHDRATLPLCVEQRDRRTHSTVTAWGSLQSLHSAFAPHQQQRGQGISQGLSLPICEMGTMLKLSEDQVEISVYETLSPLEAHSHQQ